MKKLTLNLETLAVQSFAASADACEGGPALARSGWTNCGDLTCLLSVCPDCLDVGTR